MRASFEAAYVQRHPKAYMKRNDDHHGIPGSYMAYDVQRAWEWWSQGVACVKNTITEVQNEVRSKAVVKNMNHGVYSTGTLQLDALNKIMDQINSGSLHRETHPEVSPPEELPSYKGPDYLTSAEARVVFNRLSKGLNAIRWGSPALTEDVIETMLKHCSPRSEGFRVWIVGANVGNALRCNPKQHTPERKALNNLYDATDTAVPYSIGTMLGIEVLAAAEVPPNVIILAEVVGTLVVHHVASNLNIKP